MYGYGRENKRYDLTPRYPSMVAEQRVLPPEEAVDVNQMTRPDLPKAPGVNETWLTAVKTARQKYPSPDPSYHETVQTLVRQKGLRIPYVLLRANIGDGNEASILAKNTNGNNHARSMISFLGRGVMPTVVKADAVVVAVDATRTFCDAEIASELSDAYVFWQQLTGHTVLANLAETE